MTNHEELLTELISELESSLSSWEGKPNVLLPSSTQFYRMGLVLSDLIMDSSTNINQDELLQLCRSLLDGFPNSHMRGVLEDLHEAFCKTLERFEETSSNSSDNSQDTRDVQMAVQSLHGLYGTNSKALLAAALGHPIAGWSTKKIQLLDAVYHELNRCQDIISDDENETTTIPRIKEQLLSLTAVFLEEPTIDFEDLLPAINHLQEKRHRHEHSTWEDLVVYKATHDPQWKENMVGRYTEMAQQGYLLSMFTVEEENINNSIAQKKTEATNKQNKQSHTKKASVSSPADTVQRLVQQVRSVFPHLGEGYVETALSHFHGDVERTMSTLVEGQSNPASLPVVLQRLDPQLPARWKGPTSQQSKQADEEARRITQQTVRAMEQQEETAARALEVMRVDTTHGEYDDDYDDQYDDMDGGGFTADTGLYDDFDTVRTYNKVMKQVGEEQAFWAENRNENRSNRRSQSNNKNKDVAGGEEKKYRGPDKTKGGRVPKPVSDANEDENEETNNSGRGGGGQGRGGRGGRGKGGRGGRGNGRGGGRGGGGGGGEHSSSANGNSASTTDGNANSGRGNARHKQNKLDSRRNRQKQAAAKRSG